MTAPAFYADPNGMYVTYNGQTYYLPGNTWSTNPDGSVTFNGSVWFPAAFNNASGAGIVVFGPGGGRASFPAVQPGPPRARGEVHLPDDPGRLRHTASLTQPRSR